MLPVKCWQVDAFTDRPFAGNPATVCLLTEERKAGWMQAVAAEMNLSETAFVRPLDDALNVKPSFVGKTRFDIVVVVDSEQVVRSLTPGFARLRQIPVRGVIVTSRSDNPQFDFVSRFFAPAAGIDEDPVTGSAHCCLGLLRSERLGKTEMTAFQASARGGASRLRVAGDRIYLGGQAASLLRGELV